MSKAKLPETATCHVCQKTWPVQKMVPAELVRNSVSETIRKTHPDWGEGKYICLNDLNYFRTRHMEDILEDEKGEMSKLEKKVIRSLKKHELISADINKEFDRQLTVGERVADQVAEFGGSWKFIIIFIIILIGWMIMNTVWLAQKPFDPYPFILLNLVLSSLAALQAPVIMMSQNRQEDKDRLRAEHDYRVNLKAELEIRHLNEKIDNLLQKQWFRLLEIQQIQMDFMEELAGRKKTALPPSAQPPALPATEPVAPTLPQPANPS